MNTNDLMNELARSANYPVIPRVRCLYGPSPGPWILLGAYRDRSAAENAITVYMRAHVGRQLQASVLQASDSDYPAALIQVRQMRKTRSRSRQSRQSRSR